MLCLLCNFFSEQINAYWHLKIRPVGSHVLVESGAHLFEQLRRKFMLSMGHLQYLVFELLEAVEMHGAQKKLLR